MVSMVIGLRRECWSIQQTTAETHLDAMVNSAPIKVCWHSSANMARTRNCGKFEGYRCGQTDISTRGWTHPSTIGMEYVDHFYLHSAACLKNPEFSHIGQNYLPFIGSC